MVKRPKKLRSIGSVPDIAYKMLLENGSALHYTEIVSRIVSLLPGAEHADPRLTASIHTDINMDSRFKYLGEGLWDLKDKPLIELERHKTSPDLLFRLTREPSGLYRSDEDANDRDKACDDDAAWSGDYDDASDGPEA